VDAAATWCTALPESGTGIGAVTVSIAENAATVTRTATVTFTAGTLTQQVAVEQEAADVPPALSTPPLAASTQTWTFGNQTWSDDIEIPECKGATFEGNYYTGPQCRSYTDTEGTNTWYYYNWPYMNAHKATMCPDPWRVPTQADFKALVDIVEEVGLDWNLGGHCYPDDGIVGGPGLYAYYWATDESSSTHAYSLKYWSDEIDPIYFNIGGENKATGIHVRCVQ
jgi:hypothetical protein